jgi:hypothetical protein
VSPVDVAETVVVAGAILGALKLRYDDKAGIRVLFKAQADADKRQANAEIKAAEATLAKLGEQA